MALRNRRVACQKRRRHHTVAGHFTKFIRLRQTVVELHVDVRIDSAKSAYLVSLCNVRSEEQARVSDGSFGRMFRGCARQKYLGVRRGPMVVYISRGVPCVSWGNTLR